MMCSRVLMVAALVAAFLSSATALPMKVEVAPFFANDECAVQTDKFVSLLDSEEFHKLSKAKVDAEELLREVNVAHIHDRSISEAQVATERKDALQGIDKANIALQNFYQMKADPLREKVAKLCVEQATAESPKSPLAVMWIVSSTGKGYLRYLYTRYVTIYKKLRLFIDEQSYFVHQQFRRHKVEDSDAVRVIGWNAIYLVGPAATMTCLAMIILIFLPIVVGYHFVHGFLLQLWVRELLEQAMLEQYGNAFELTTGTDVLNHFASSYPHHVGVVGVGLLVLSLFSALVSLPWTMPIIGMVVGPAKESRTNVIEQLRRMQANQEAQQQQQQQQQRNNTPAASDAPPVTATAVRKGKAKAEKPKQK